MKSGGKITEKRAKKILGYVDDLDVVYLIDIVSDEVIEKLRS